MPFVLSGLVHVSVLVGLALFLRETFALIKDAPDRLERNMRLLALSVGFVTFLGARAVGINVPDLLAAALANITPVRLAIAGVVLPSGAGVFTAWFLLRGLQKRDTRDKLVRLTVMLTTFTTVLFADVYAELALRPLANSSRPDASPHLLPNLAFFLGLSLYVVLKTPGSSAGKAANWEDGL